MRRTVRSCEMPGMECGSNRLPQGLKALVFCGMGGAAEAAPVQSYICESSSV
jgi:hypothetical protein